MARLLISEEKINGLAAVLFILGLGTLYYLGYPDLWPGMMIAAGISMVVRQFLLGRQFGLLLAVVIFGGAWAALYFDFHTKSAIPLLAALGALYILIVQMGRFHMKPGPKVEVTYPQEEISSPEESEIKG